MAAKASTALLTALIASRADVKGLLDDVVVGRLGGSEIKQTTVIIHASVILLSYSLIFRLGIEFFFI